MYPLVLVQTHDLQAHSFLPNRKTNLIRYHRLIEGISHTFFICFNHDDYTNKVYIKIG